MLEHLFNCHGEWAILLSFLPGGGLFTVYGRNHLWKFWKFLCGIPASALSRCQLLWHQLLWWWSILNKNV